MDDAELKTRFAAWIGKRIERTDCVDRRLVEQFTVMLEPYLAKSCPVPPGIFWCLSPDLAPADQLGGDGHPRTGLFMPDLPFPRRMWAGGELVFHADFPLDKPITKTTTIEDIAVKTGKSGQLAFVTARHHYRDGEKLLLDERQDIVYREPAPLAPSQTLTAAPASCDASDRWTVEASSVLLFRYSALTFNGHRIHYDFPYATGVEGYAGLVVHGPLQATLMLNRVATHLGRMPKRFAYRGQSPLISGSSFHVETTADPEAKMNARVVSSEGIVTMVAQAEP